MPHARLVVVGRLRIELSPYRLDQARRPGWGWASVIIRSLTRLSRMNTLTGRRVFSLPAREAQASIGYGDLARYISRCRAGKEHDHLGDVFRR